MSINNNPSVAGTIDPALSASVETDALEEGLIAPDILGDVDPEALGMLVEAEGRRIHLNCLAWRML